MEPRIFISHAWHRYELYASLAQILNEITERKWVDLSIPRNQGLQFLSHGEKALLEEVDLQEQVIETASQERFQLQQTMTQLENEARTKENQLDMERDDAEGQLAIEQRIAASLLAEMSTIDGTERLEERIKTCTERVRELTEKAAGEKLVDAERDYLSTLKNELQSRDLQELKIRRQRIETSLSQVESRRKKVLSLIADLDQQRAALRSGWQPIADRILGITKEINWCRERILRLTSEESPDLYNVFARTSSLFGSVKGNTDLATRFPTLSLAIYERIQRANLVIAIAGTYDQYRAWMEFDFAITADRGKPLIAVIPPDQVDIPVELQYYVTHKVRWERQEISHALQRAISLSNG